MERNMQQYCDGQNAVGLSTIISCFRARLAEAYVINLTRLLS